MNGYLQSRMAHDHEVLQFVSAAEFQDRLSYHEQLVASSEELDRIVGKYGLPKPRMSWVKCGLNGCNEPHRKGYLIRLHDGRETNLGNDCGARHFGVKWEEVEARAKAAETATATRNAVDALLATRDAQLARANALVDPCRTLEERVLAVRTELHKHHALWRKVEQCAKLDGSIRVAIEAPPGGGGYSKSRSAMLRTIGRIDGARLLLPDFTRYSNIIEKNVLPSLVRFDAALLRDATVKELAAHSKSGAALSSSIDRAELQLAEGRKLFAAGNLQRLELIVDHQLRSDDIKPQLRAALDRIYAM